MTTISLRSLPPMTPDVLQLTASGFALSSILFAAVELRVFDLLEDAPSSGDELAKKAGLSADGVRRLLVALESMGLVHRDEAGVYRNAAIASAALLSQAPGSAAPFVEHLQKHFYDLFATLPSAIREGRPQLERWRFGEQGASNPYELLEKNPDEYARFLAAMDAAARGVGERIASQLDWSGLNHLADFGHGGGIVGRDLLRALPNLRITAVDLGPACSFARARAQEEQLADRIAFVAHDIRRPLVQLSAVDAVLLSGVISDFEPHDRRKVLENAFRVIRPGGKLILSETLFDEDRRGPFLPAMLSLAMFVLTGGDNFTGAEMTAMLEEAGFRDVEVHRNGHLGLRDTICATRP